MVRRGLEGFEGYFLEEVDRVNRQGGEGVEFGMDDKCIVPLVGVWR